MGADSQDTGRPASEVDPAGLYRGGSRVQVDLAATALFPGRAVMREVRLGSAGIGRSMQGRGVIAGRINVLTMQAIGTAIR